MADDKPEALPTEVPIDDDQPRRLEPDLPPEIASPLAPFAGASPPTPAWFDRAIAVENKWRAQRYGVQGSFVTRTGGIAVSEMLDRILGFVAPDAEALGCAEQVGNCRAIVVEGTSADAQLRIFTENKHEGAEIALHKVTRWIRDATLVA